MQYLPWIIIALILAALWGLKLWLGPRTRHQHHSPAQHGSHHSKAPAVVRWILFIFFLTGVCGVIYSDRIEPIKKAFVLFALPAVYGLWAGKATGWIKTFYIIGSIVLILLYIPYALRKRGELLEARAQVILGQKVHDPEADTQRQRGLAISEPQVWKGIFTPINSAHWQAQPVKLAWGIQKLTFTATSMRNRQDTFEVSVKNISATEAEGWWTWTSPGKSTRTGKATCNNVGADATTYAPSLKGVLHNLPAYGIGDTNTVTLNWTMVPESRHGAALRSVRY